MIRGDLCGLIFFPLTCPICGVISSGITSPSAEGLKRTKLLKSMRIVENELMRKITKYAEDPGQGSRATGPNALENLFCALVFFFSLALYVKTLCPAVFWWDSGELIANIAVLGIPHRPGFPIYVLLGKIFSFLPLGSFAWRVNFLSALFASFSLAILFKVFQRSLNLFFPRMIEKGKSVLLSSLSFVLVFGFTYSFWIQAVRAEVYSLNVLFFSLLLLSGISYLKDGRTKYVYLFFFLLGLGLGNHHLSLLSTIPAFLMLFLVYAPGVFLHLKKIFFQVLFLLLGLSIYLYLPIRSISHPPLVWGKTESISSAASFVFALDTMTNLNLDFLSNIAEKISQMGLLFYDQLTFLCLAVSLLGFFLLLRNGRKLLIFLLLLIMGNCAVTIFITTELIPTNPDLHGYLIFSVFALTFSFGMGIFFLLNLMRGLSPPIRYLIMMVLGFISLSPLFQHYTEANLSRNRIAHNYGLSVIARLDSNSILFVDNVNLNFILRELLHAEEIRKDVEVIDRGLLGFRWYVEQKKRQNRNLFSGVPEGLTGEPLFGALLKRSKDLGMPVYIEFTERDAALVDYVIPEGYVFKVHANPIDLLTEKDLLSQKRWVQEGPFDPEDETFQRDWDAQRVYALSFYRLGLFYELKGMISCALDKFARVRKIDPENEELILKVKKLKELEASSGISNQNSSAPPAQPPG